VDELSILSPKYAIFGNPLGQSLSPLMHNAAFAKIGIDARYGICETDDAEQAIRRFREMGLRGASVTIPFKETIIPLLDEVDETAREIGAVNTIVERDGRLTGFNTDGIGLILDLKEWLDEIRIKTFVILGAGGAARAAVYSLLQEGAIPIVVNRTPERAEALAGRFGCRWVPFGGIDGLRADVLINTTPVGMYPKTDATPLSQTQASRFAYVMDMIYNPVKTRLLREAAASGCAIRSGLGMFVHQGAEQFRIWTGMKPPVERMRNAVMERLLKHG
jgi:shikimate dehydrogenase